jgi:phosphoglucomutase
MSVHPLAGKPAPKEVLIDIGALLAAYTDTIPDATNPAQLVSFGTSGHRGTSTDGTFTDAHIAAISQAICDYRAQQKISGPLYMGRDTHALSIPAQETALEVLAANGVHTLIADAREAVPTPVISHAILSYNAGRKDAFADGIIITPSHNPPADGGFKYNPPNGGPADTSVTKWIENRANELLREKNAPVKRLPLRQAMTSEYVRVIDLISAYVNDLTAVVDIPCIQSAGLSIGVDPLGGSSLRYWERIASAYALNLKVVNTVIDPQFSFMTLDHDGKIRMDCSSPYAMANLLKFRSSFDLSFGNDPDADRHGVVTKSSGLMNPNHYLAACVFYLFQNRDGWPKQAAVGKTLVSSSVIDRVARMVSRKIYEVPVGFKWFVAGLLDGSLGFGGEESAGASFLRFNGKPWSTDKDGLILNLLACEMTARIGKDPGEVFESIVAETGRPYYQRVDQAISAEQKSAFKNLSPEKIAVSSIAGEAIQSAVTKAAGNGEAIGGIKVSTQNGWFAARPSGTEDIYKLYAESLRSEEHLQQIISEGQAIVSAALQQ